MEKNESDNVVALRDFEKTIESVFRSHYKRLCSYAYTLLQDADESEEVVQEVFIRILEKRESMDVNVSLQSYLFRSVRNACLNKFKHQKVRQEYVVEAIALSQAEPSSQISYQNELQSQIHASIESLPEQCRLIFKLSRFEELKYAEIAQQLGISIKTVENQMGKALRIMREKLTDYLVLIIVALHYATQTIL